MIPGCLSLAYEGMRCIADASRCSASEGARGPNIVAASAHRGLRVRQSKGGQREEGDGGGGGGRRKRVEIGKGLEEKEGEGSSQATASRHNSELPRCEGRIDSIALTLYAPALCIYVNA